MTPALVPMRWWDVQDVAALEAQLFERSAWSAEIFWSELAAPGRTYLVARAAGTAGAAGADDELLGYAGLALAGADADVQTLAVAPAARRLGLGRVLLRALLDRARGQGAHHVVLEVAADNAPARALYEAEGFTRIAVRRGYYAPEGTDAHVMRRRLP